MMQKDSGLTGDYLLNDSLLEHCLCNLHEAGDVRALHVVDVTVRLGTVFHTSLVDIRHDRMEFLVHLCRTPADVHCVLSHLEA